MTKTEKGLYRIVKIIEEDTKRIKQDVQDKLFDKILRMVDHYDWLLKNKKITRKEYNEGMMDLGKWANMGVVFLDETGGKP